MRSKWFSAMLRFVVLIEGEGGTRLARSVIVFRSKDWPEAKMRARALGQGMEDTYTNGAGEEVRWRLESVETLDLLGRVIADGREVYSEPTPLPTGEVFEFDTEFDPSGTEPTQSGV